MIRTYNRNKSNIKFGNFEKYSEAYSIIERRQKGKWH